MDSDTITIIAAAAVLIIAAGFLLLRLLLRHLTNRRVAVFQNDLIARHLEEVQSIYREIRGWRHDYHNHIQTMQALLAVGDDAELSAYLLKLNSDLGSIDNIIRSGNVMADAILNSKLSLARNHGVSINVKAVVPQYLTVSDIDLCVVLGNLIDNAIEANLRIPEGGARFLRIYIDIKGGQLYISVTNASGGRAVRSHGRYLSTKSGEFHGFGIGRVDRIIAKYGGYIRRGDEEGAFTSEVLLPL